MPTPCPLPGHDPVQVCPPPTWSQGWVGDTGLAVETQPSIPSELPKLTLSDSPVRAPTLAPTNAGSQRAAPEGWWDTPQAQLGPPSTRAVVVGTQDAAMPRARSGSWCHPQTSVHHSTGQQLRWCCAGTHQRPAATPLAQTLTSASPGRARHARRSGNSGRGSGQKCCRGAPWGHPRPCLGRYGEGAGVSPASALLAPPWLALRDTPPPQSSQLPPRCPPSLLGCVTRSRPRDW